MPNLFGSHDALQAAFKEAGEVIGRVAMKSLDATIKREIDKVVKLAIKNIEERKRGLLPIDSNRMNCEWMDIVDSTARLLLYAKNPDKKLEFVTLEEVVKGLGQAQRACGPPPRDPAISSRKLRTRPPQQQQYKAIGKMDAGRALTRKGWRKRQWEVDGKKGVRVYYIKGGIDRSSFQPAGQAPEAQA